MSDHEQDPDLNPDPGHPQGETLPEQSPREGEAAEEKASDFEGQKAGKGGDESHGSGEHETTNI